MLKYKKLGGPCHAENIWFPCIMLFIYGLVLYRLQYMQGHFMDWQLCFYMHHLLFCSLKNVSQEVCIDRSMSNKVVNVFFCESIHFSDILYIFLRSILQLFHVLFFVWKLSYLLNQRDVTLIMDLMDFIVKVMACFYGFRNLVVYSPGIFPAKLQKCHFQL